MNNKLGALAMRFRGTRDEAERRSIAGEYAEEVRRLVATGLWWQDFPAPEDTLPDEWMPKEYWAYWELKCPTSA